METTSPRPQDIIDTTDSLEAIGACKSMKNFLFFVILICLLLTQIIFWMTDFGLIRCAGYLPCTGYTPMTGSSEQPKQCGCDNPLPPCETGAMPLAATMDVAEEVRKVTDQIEQNQPQTTLPGKEMILEKPEKYMPAEIPAEDAATQPQSNKFGLPFQIPCFWVMKVVSVCNFLLLLASILYSLTLLVCLKISLTGRLGGINHIARAFFISLLLMVVLIPWQQLLPKVLVGTVWLPGELFCGGWAKSQYVMFWKVLFYIRFVGLWIAAMWFLLWAQIRSAKWARTTLRRLGIVR